MNRRHFLLSSTAAVAGPLSVVTSGPLLQRSLAATAETRVAVLLVDTERVIAPIDERIYGHFLEHINHSVEDGLYAEQIHGCGFEGKDFETYWKAFSDRGSVEIADIEFRNGKKSVRLKPEGGRAGIRQGRIYVDAGQKYDGSRMGPARSRLPAVNASRHRAQRANRSRPYRSLRQGSDWEEIPLFILQFGQGHTSVRRVGGGRQLERCWSTTSR